MSNPVKATPPEFTEVLTRLGEAVDETVTEFGRLRDLVKTSMTQAEVDAYRASVDARIDQLKALKIDPNNPQPPVFAKKRP